MFDIAKELTINRDALDMEWLEQAEKYHQVSTIAAEARSEFDRAKLNQEIAEAQIDKAIRSDPEKYGLAKVSEAAILKVLTLQEPVIAAKKEVIAAREHLALVDGAVTAFEHRKKALESLVYLHGQNYFATPRENGHSDEMLEGGRFRKLSTKLNDQMSGERGGSTKKPAKKRTVKVR